MSLEQHFDLLPFGEGILQGGYTYNYLSKQLTSSHFKKNQILLPTPLRNKMLTMLMALRGHEMQLRTEEVMWPFKSCVRALGSLTN